MTLQHKTIALMTTTALAMVTLDGADVSAQETFPNKPINITVTFPPGGGTDILARLIGNYMSETLGHGAIVENKPGASGNVGAKYLADRAPDGYSLLMVNSSFAINPAVFSKLPFDPKKDFVPIVNMAWIPSVLVVPANSPYKTLAELLNAAKPAKNDVSYGSCGNGTPQHLAGASLNIFAKTHITHIPYGGCGPALKDVLGGQIPLAIITASSAMTQIQAGKLRALATTGAKRDPTLPDLPTIAEAGVANYESGVWFGLSVPVGTPPEIIAKLSGEAIKGTKSPDYIKRMTDLGYNIMGYGPAQMAEMNRAEVARWGPIVKASGAKAD